MNAVGRHLQAERRPLVRGRPPVARLPELGARRLTDVQRRDVQSFVDDLLASGRDPSTIRNALMPLRIIYRRALEDGDVAVNPCAGLRLPASRGRRDRIVSPEQATTLLASLAQSDRALWALALYAGLRRGEIMALRWEDIDLAGGIIRVSGRGTRSRVSSSSPRAAPGGAGCRSRPYFGTSLLSTSSRREASSSPRERTAACPSTATPWRNERRERGGAQSSSRLRSTRRATPSRA
jgi:integrase